MIIGITGTLGAGKGEVVNYLKQKGFAHYSVREFLVEEIKKRGLPLNRDSMVLVGNDLRKKHGPGYIAQELYARAKQDGRNAVIESFRTVGEVEALERAERFSLIAIDADPRIRYKRIIKRASETDKISYEKFLEDEEREMKSDDSAKQNISAVLKKADFVILNDGTIAELHCKAKEALGKFGLSRSS